MLTSCQLTPPSFDHNLDQGPLYKDLRRFHCEKGCTFVHEAPLISTLISVLIHPNGSVEKGVRTFSVRKQGSYTRPQVFRTRGLTFWTHRTIQD